MTATNPVSKFTQPDFTAQSAVVYKTALDDAANVFKRVAGRFAPHEAATPNLTVVLDPGWVYVSGASSITELASQITASIAAPGSNHRLDMISINRSTGSAVYTSGVADVAAVLPAIPANTDPVAQVRVSTGVTALGNADISDIRTQFSSTPIANLSITASMIAANAVDGTKIAMGSDAEGDILFYSSTGNYDRLPQNTDGFFLKTQGPNKPPLWAAAGFMVNAAYNEDGVVRTGTTTVALSSTIPVNTEGDEYLSASITPSDVANKLLIQVHLNVATTGGGTGIIGMLFQDAKASAICAAIAFNAGNNQPLQIDFTFEMVASTTSSTTFKVRAGVDVSGTMTLNGVNGSGFFGGVGVSAISILEFKP